MKSNYSVRCVAGELWSMAQCRKCGVEKEKSKTRIWGHFVTKLLANTSGELCNCISICVCIQIFESVKESQIRTQICEHVHECVNV